MMQVERDDGEWRSCGPMPLRGLARIGSFSLSIALLVFCLPAFAKPRFHASEIEDQGSEMMIGDLDGDHYQDVVLIDGSKLAVFYQDPERGFHQQPDQRHSLGARPSIVWPAKMGRDAESLLVMTREGVTELGFTIRTAPPASAEIIKQPTVIPESLDEPSVKYFPLSASTGGDWPLVLVPVDGDLQVWQHRQAWNRAQTLERALDTQIWPAVSNPGYTRWTGLSLSVGDLNRDRRDDLIITRRSVTGKQTYTFYRQYAEGSFASDLALAYEDKPDSRTWLCWADINQDHQLDLIKCTWLNEPWFLPGTRSGKVLVGIHFADDRGRIPAEPQQVFRKNDWMAALPVVDVDGDGFLDLVLGQSLFDSREGLRKMITAKQLDFSLKFHFYRAEAAFPKDPDFQRNLLIHLDQHSLHLTWSRREYFERFVNLNGDFNGDGKRDLLVKDRGHQVSVYFFISRQKGFSQEPDLRFSCPEPIDRFEVSDLNGDGVSDLIIKLQKPGALRIFTSEK